jgi:hypothetical protein
VGVYKVRAKAKHGRWVFDLEDKKNTNRPSLSFSKLNLNFSLIKIQYKINLVVLKTHNNNKNNNKEIFRN